MIHYDYMALIDRHYLPGTAVREILLTHSRNVADKALDIARRKGLDLSEAEIEAASMIHDIGIFLTDASGIECYGKEHYLRHGILGADLLRNDGAPEWLARVAERHTGSGITVDEIRQLDLPLPVGDYVPETQLERLVCYADKFYSKTKLNAEKPFDKVRASLARYGSGTLNRFDKLHEEFGG